MSGAESLGRDAPSPGRSRAPSRGRRGRDLDVGRLQIAVDDAALVRGLERLGDLPRDRERSSTGSGAASRSAPRASRPRRAPSRAPLSPPLPRGRRSRAMFGWLSEASSCASRSKRARRSRIAARTRPGRILIATSRPQPRVARAIDLAHAAGAERRDDLVEAEAGAGLEGHENLRGILCPHCA